MFTEDEVREYDKLFEEIGIADEALQKKIVEFFYTFGTIVYNNINKVEL